MKTIALKEKTFQILEELKRRMQANSFDELLTELVIKPEIPKSMFGSLKRKIKSFTEKERKKLWKEE